MVLGGPAFVVMMETTDFANLDHLASCWSMDSSGLRGVLAERQVSAPVMIIGSVPGERTMQGAFAEDDNMIQTVHTKNSIAKQNQRPADRNLTLLNDFERRAFAGGGQASATS
jgi:hypothetical protein